MDRFEQIINIRLALKDQSNKKEKLEEKGLEGACWPGYEAIGLKDDGSPNCVPIKENQIKIKKEGFPIPSPSSDEDEEKYIGRCISSITDEYDTDQAYAICKSKWDEK
jgi:hypothetical protein